MYDIFYLGSPSDYFKKLKQQYPLIRAVDSFEEAKKKSLTKFFWIVPSDVRVDETFCFDYTPDEWSLDYIHVFKNGNNWDGIALFPRRCSPSEIELQTREYKNNKKIDIIASQPKSYEVFVIDTYDEYLAALENATTEMFWMSSRNIDADIPDTYFTHDNIYDRKINHVFLHDVNGETSYNGLFLCSKHTPLSKREVEYRHIVNRKEWDVVASKAKPYDIIFISYQEPNADKNYQLLKEKFPRAKRIHEIKGIHQAHIAAAKLCDTDMFWVVDADAQIVDDFNFNYRVPDWDRDAVHVWRSQNPVNDLVYGYGGVKLLPRKLTIDMDTSKPDMTTSISNKFKAMPGISNVTAFNTDPFSTWRSAFRECVKLASRSIDRQQDNETEQRLNAWCTLGQDKMFGEYSVRGAVAGREYGYDNKDNLEALALINDFDWLERRFKEE